VHFAFVWILFDVRSVADGEGDGEEVFVPIRVIGGFFGLLWAA